MHAAYGAVYGMLYGAFAALQSVERFADVVVERSVVGIAQVEPGYLLGFLEFLDER